MLRRGHRQSCGNDPKLSFAQLWDRRQSKSDCQHSVRSFLHPRPCPRGTQPLSPCKCTTLVYFHSQVGRILCIRIEARGRRNHSSFVGRPEKAAVLCDLEVVELIEMHCTLVIPLATPITLHSLLIFVVNCRTISF